MHPAADSKRPPAFLFYGYEIPLKPEIYQPALAEIPEEFRGYESPQRAIARLDAFMAELPPHSSDDVDFNGWDRERRTTLMSVIHTAALSGLFAYPPRRDTSPSGHGAAEMMDGRRATDMVPEPMTGGGRP
jgi:hypothetical protein